MGTDFIAAAMAGLFSDEITDRIAHHAQQAPRPPTLPHDSIGSGSQPMPQFIDRSIFGDDDRP